MQELLQQKNANQISIEECKTYLGGLGLTDEEIEEARDLLYVFVEQVLDYVIEEGLVSGK